MFSLRPGCGTPGDHGGAELGQRQLERDRHANYRLCMLALSSVRMGSGDHGGAELGQRRLERDRHAHYCLCMLALSFVCMVPGDHGGAKLGQRRLERDRHGGQLPRRPRGGGHRRGRAGAAQVAIAWVSGGFLKAFRFLTSPLRQQTVWRQPGACIVMLVPGCAVSQGQGQSYGVGVVCLLEGSSPWLQLASQCPRALSAEAVSLGCAAAPASRPSSAACSSSAQRRGTWTGSC